MNVNDHILTKMIEQDLKSKSVSNYTLLDEVATDPKQIKVGTNEVVYVCYLEVIEPKTFDVKLSSATSLVSYTPFNTHEKTSSVISAHWSNIDIIKKNPKTVLYVRFIRVTINN